MAFILKDIRTFYKGLTILKTILFIHV